MQSLQVGDGAVRGVRDETHILVQRTLLDRRLARLPGLSSLLKFGIRDLQVERVRDSLCMR